MRHYPSLPEIVAGVEALLLPRRKKAPQGRKPRYSDERIIALAGLYNPAPCLRMDSKKLPTAALARAKRVRLRSGPCQPHVLLRIALTRAGG